MSVTVVLLLGINVEYLKFTMSGCLVHFYSYSIIMTIIDVFNTLWGFNFSIYCIMHVLHSTFSHFHFPQAFFEQSVFFIKKEGFS